MTTSRHGRRAVALLLATIVAVLTPALLPGASAVGYTGTADVDDPILNPLPDPAPSDVGLVLERWVTLPATAPSSGTVTDKRLVRHNRINHLSELPDGSGRMAVPDLNGPLHLLRDNGSRVTYLNLNAYFPDIHNHAGLGTGFGFVEFHPEFAANGTFYTVHTESGDALTDHSPDFPVFRSAGIHSVITEWVATNPSADRFSGTRSEMMRIPFAGGAHTVQQIAFDPTAAPGDPDYGLLYVLVGDGGNGVDNGNPQNLATPHGTIFRVDPMGTDGRTGRYGIPDDNPFVGVPRALPEIYAVGMRDPHRVSWDPAGGNRMFLGHIGEWQVESVYEVRPGDNYGWSEREGPFRAQGRQLFPLPPDDARYGFTYPVAAYDHSRDPGQTGDAGVALAGGFVYRGDIDVLDGLYIFTDLVRGYPYAARASQMRRGEDRAPIEHLRIVVNGEETTFAELNADEDPNDGDDDRIDLRVGRDAEGELYLLSKGSGTIWKVVDAVVVDGPEWWREVATSQVAGDYEVLPGDFTGDGRDDLFFYGPGQAPDFLRRSNGNGTFAEGVRVRVDGNYDAFVGDLAPPIAVDDIVWRLRGGSVGYLWRFTGDGAFTSHAVTFPIGATGVVLDHSRLAPRYDELLWHRPGPGGDRVDGFLLDGGVLRPRSRPITVSGSFTAVTGDFDANGWADVFWYAPGMAPDWVWHHTSTDGVATTGHRNTSRPVNGTYTAIGGRFAAADVLAPNDAAEDVYLHSPTGSTYLLTGGGTPFREHRWSHADFNRVDGGYHRIPTPWPGAPALRGTPFDELLAAQPGDRYRVFTLSDVVRRSAGAVSLRDDGDVVTGDFFGSGQDAVYLFRGSAGPEALHVDH